MEKIMNDDFDDFFNELMSDPEFRIEYYRIHYIDEIANQILLIRTGKNLTKNQLSELSGIPVSIISRIENGDENKVPPLKTIQKLAEALGYKISISITEME
jgi:predicted transcriptional regulator